VTPVVDAGTEDLPWVGERREQAVDLDRVRPLGSGRGVLEAALAVRMSVSVSAYEVGNTALRARRRTLGRR
jgi:hypothetical protein